jgi:hypothetical protein
MLAGPVERSPAIVRLTDADQFGHLADASRLGAERPRELVEIVERQTLAKIMRRNTGIGREISDDVWHAH